MRAQTVIQMLVALALTLVAAPAWAGKARTTRVEFDDTLIKGQTNRGAVHLIERKDSNLGSMLKKRKNFRREILAPYGFEADSGLARNEQDVVAPTQADKLGAKNKKNKPVAKARTKAKKSRKRSAKKAVGKKSRL